MIFGKVRQFNKDYGFIDGDDGRDYFVHKNFIMTKGVFSLNEGAKVKFNAFESKKGWQAVNVLIDYDEEELITLSSNPFTPQTPVVDPLKFAGRRDAIISAIQSIYNCDNIFITGTRGVGKTSLANQLKVMVQGDSKLLNRFNFDTRGVVFKYLVLSHICAPNHELKDITSSFISDLQNSFTEESGSTETKTVREYDFKFYKHKIEETKNKDTMDLVNILASLIKKTWKSLPIGYNGIMLCIDEIDCLQKSVPMGYFLKSLTECVSSQGVKRFNVLLVGNESYINRIQKQHKSTMRIFECLNVPLMAEKEIIDVIEKALDDNSVSANPNAVRVIARHCAGSPSYAQLIGYHSYRINRGETIGYGDVQRAISYILTEVKQKELSSIISNVSNNRYLNLLDKLSLKGFDGALKEEFMYSGDSEEDLNELSKKGLIKMLAMGKYVIADPLLLQFLRLKNGCYTNSL